MFEALMGWIEHDGGECPCVGECVEVRYSDGYLGRERAECGSYWRYVTHYRLIADPSDLV